MSSRFRWFGPVAFASIALVIGCGGGSSGPGAPAPPTTSTKPGPTGSATAKPTATASAAPTLNPTPSPSPTPFTAACQAPAEPVPGTYTVVATRGTVSGTSYVQSGDLGAGTWTAVSYSAIATTAPSANPTQTVGPTQVPTKKPSLPDAKKTPKPTPTPTQSPTPAPSPTGTPYIAYSGSYTVGGFSGTGSGGPFTVSPTVGCITLLATQSGQPILPGGDYNSSAKGTPYFGQFIGINAVDVGAGNITAFSIQGLGPKSGTGTFTLDNAATGTVTIQSSEHVTLDRFRNLFERGRWRPFGAWPTGTDP